MKYQRITLEGWDEIFWLRSMDRLSMKEIRKKLGRDTSSILRELQRGTKNKIYNPLTEEVTRQNM
jgi:IS30 family transposase